MDQSSGTFFVGSVKEGTIYKGKIARPSLEVFSPGDAGWSQHCDGNVFADEEQVGLLEKLHSKAGYSRVLKSVSFLSLTLPLNLFLPGVHAEDKLAVIE